MGIRRTLTCAAGAFLMTTVLFVAAMVIAHGLIIPDPVGRVLPMAGRERADAAGEDATEQVALVQDRAPRPPRESDGVPEITAVPVVPDDDAVAMTDSTNSESAAGDPATDRDDGVDASGSDDATRGGSPDAPTEREVAQARPPARDDRDTDEERPQTGRTSPPTRQRGDDDQHPGWNTREDDDARARFRWNPRDDDQVSVPGFFDFFQRQADGWPSERDDFGRRDDRDGWYRQR
jgi:hypothetical protein